MIFFCFNAKKMFSLVYEQRFVKDFFSIITRGLSGKSLLQLRRPLSVQTSNRKVDSNVRNTRIFTEYFRNIIGKIFLRSFTVVNIIISFSSLAR